jgi:hypothetical protein
MKHVHVELLLGKRVRDANDKVVGRIQSIRATWKGNACVVDEYHLGTAALMEKLGISAKRLIGVGNREPVRVPWDQLDLSNPERPCLKCTIDALKKMVR